VNTKFGSARWQQVLSSKSHLFVKLKIFFILEDQATGGTSSEAAGPS
jgi:hypothetical protein